MFFCHPPPHLAGDPFPSPSFLLTTFTSYSFLNDVGRITSRDYEPSPDDVVRARLRTMGVQEYKFVFDKGGLTL